MSVNALLCPRCVRTEGLDFLVRNLKCQGGARASVRARLVGTAGSGDFEPAGVWRLRSSFGCGVEPMRLGVQVPC